MLTYVMLLAPLAPFFVFLLMTPKILQQERRKLESFYPTLAYRGPMTADEITEAAGTSGVLRRWLVDAIEEAADAGRIQRKPPVNGERAVRYTVRKLRPRPAT
jgi:hypothetical protein